jgi:hypothetical protein
LSLSSSGSPLPIVNLIDGCVAFASDWSLSFSRPPLPSVNLSHINGSVFSTGGPHDLGNQVVVLHERVKEVVRLCIACIRLGTSERWLALPFSPTPELSRVA